MACRIRRKIPKIATNAKGEIMSKMIDTLTDAADKVLKGEIPLKTGEVVHKLGNSSGHCKHADCRAQEIGLEDETKAALNKIKTR